jgi:hypothetical protein
MTIKEITEDSIEQTCEVCGQVRSANLDNIAIGVVNEDRINGDIIPLPKCESCGAIEYLIPSKEDEPDHPSPGSLGHRHAMLVDVLHERLAKRGRVAEGVEANKLKKKKRPKEELDHWFKEGLKLEKPSSDSDSDDGKKPKQNEEVPDAE